MENKWLCDLCLKRDVCLIQITHNADTPIVDCNFYLDKEQEPTTKNYLSEEDILELKHRYGDEVEFVVRDMISGEGKRWE